MSTNPKVYVRCLSSYNAGKLLGKWIEISGKSESELQDEVNELLRRSDEEPAEEWAIHDTEDMPSSVGEYTSLKTLAEIGAVHAQNEEAFGRVMALYDHFCRASTIEECLQYHEDNYAGTYDDDKDYAEEQWTNSGQLESVPEHVKRYIDWESVARDMELNGEFFTVEIDGEKHYYYNR